MPNETRPNQIKAISFGSTTLVGVQDGPYPLKVGNCFSLIDEVGEEYRVINISSEDLQELIRLQVVDLPIDIEIWGTRWAMVRDIRVPKEWWRVRACAVCIPENLRDEYLLEIDHAD